LHFALNLIHKLYSHKLVY